LDRIGFVWDWRDYLWEQAFAALFKVQAARGTLSRTRVTPRKWAATWLVGCNPTPKAEANGGREKGATEQDRLYLARASKGAAHVPRPLLRQGGAIDQKRMSRGAKKKPPEFTPAALPHPPTPPSPAQRRHNVKAICCWVKVFSVVLRHGQ